MRTYCFVLGVIAFAFGACTSDDTNGTSSGNASSSSGASTSSGSGGSSGSTTSSSGAPGDGGTGDGGSGDGGATPGQGSGGTGGLVGASVTLAGCTDCRVHVPPSYATKKPAPLLVALHGDEGPSAGVPSVIQLWTSAADKHGYLVLAVPCSSQIGCADGNYSGWLAGQGYRITAQNMAVINGWADKMEELYDVDTKREYLGGYSGGAYVLGYFAQAQADRYAGAAFVAGGMPAWTGTGQPCPAKKIPGYFLGGEDDFRTEGQMTDTKNAFATCMQEAELVVVAGADHGQTIATLGAGRGDAILTWFNARPLK